VDGQTAIELSLSSAGGEAVERIFVDTSPPRRRPRRGESAQPLTADVTAIAPSATNAEIRRAGTAAANGEWIMLLPADARVDDSTLTALLGFLASDAIGVDVVALRPCRVSPDGRGRVLPAFRERWQRAPVRVPASEFVDLPLAAAVIRRTAIVEADPFETEPLDDLVDAVLFAALADRSDTVALAPIDGVVPTRPARLSAVFRSESAHYLDRLEAGHLAALRSAARPARARAFLHELQLLMSGELSTSSKAVVLATEERARVRALAREGLRLLRSAAALPAWPASEIGDVLRAWTGEPLPVAVERGPDDPARDLVRVRYRANRPVDGELFLSRGATRAPVFAKWRRIDIFGQEEVWERIAWVARDVDALRVNGAEHSIVGAPEEAAARPRGVRARFRRARRSWLSRAALVRMVTRRLGAGRRFADAWVFMDRADIAGDNAEHLYRWMRRHHPEVNAWFVLDADSPDFARLAAEGFRMIEYGSVAHQLALHACAEYLSSHAGLAVAQPRGDRLISSQRTHRFTFLQHGVIHNDLSLWLNRQQIDVFVTTTADEREAIAGDGSAYVFTDREVVLTGMPRYDRLRELSARSPWEQRDTILLAPTWRNAHFEPASRPGAARAPRPGFHDTRFVRDLMGLLTSSALAAWADESAGRVVLLPHPNIAAHLPLDDLPAHVSVARYGGDDIPALLSRTRVFVTDYSSVAFDAAFAGSAVVYAQADAREMFGRDHTILPGYFDYGRDGFGPIVDDPDDAVSAIVRAAREGRGEPYDARVARAFVHWDARSSQRIYDTLIERRRRAH